MSARYAIYDPRTDRDISEFPDLREAYIEIDRLGEIHGLRYGVRIAKEHRVQVERAWEISKVRSALERTARND